MTKATKIKPSTVAPTTENLKASAPLAKTSRAPADFWNKMYTYTRGQAYQFTMGF